MCRYYGKTKSCLIVQNSEVLKMLLALLRLEFSLHGEALELCLTPSLCWKLSLCASVDKYTPTPVKVLIPEVENWPTGREARDIFFDLEPTKCDT